MDLACGDGFYTRRLKQRGAAEVIGVDISPIRLAKQSEHAEPLGISYQLGDAVSLPRLGSFDLVTAIYPLTYALKRGSSWACSGAPMTTSVRAGASSP
jgi:ubiquinone/menaquinone biosynthesis C-methylase UbiE